MGKWPKKVGKWPLLRDQSGQKNWVILVKNRVKWAKNGLFGVFFVKNPTYWPLAHFYFYLIVKKKLKLYIVLRKKVAKWPEH